ncbi:TOXD [Diaporthe helianthi]|uniref:TOXD n=1 Tax=Diaporthe helianthi TaxID=158607 RepID=A0A2P5I9Z2_DIAHE|nr:TOXD [Diaporthe helianthi]
MTITGIPDYPERQRAIVQAQSPPGKLVVTSDRLVPNPNFDEVLVRVHAVAVNPSDWKMTTQFPSPGAGCGMDFSGVVVAAGSGLDPKMGIAVGDVVAGAVHGANPIDPQAGSFAEYTAAFADLLWKPPRSCCGYRVIATCSPRNADMVSSYGAEHTFDYNSASCAADIRAYTNNTLHNVLDTIVDARSILIANKAMGRSGGRYAGLEALPDDVRNGTGSTRKTINWTYVMGTSMIGREEGLTGPYYSKPRPERRAFGKWWFRTVVQDLVDKGLLKPHPVKLMDGGLDAVPNGIRMLQDKALSIKEYKGFVGERLPCPNFAGQSTLADSLRNPNFLLPLRNIYELIHNVLRASIRELVYGLRSTRN